MQIWTEVASGIGAVNFLTGAGGFLQSLIYGFGGIRNYPFYLEIDPPAVFPAEGVTKLKFTGMNYLNTKFDLEITETELVFQCLSNYAIIVTIKGEAGVEVDFTCPGNFFLTIPTFRVLPKNSFRAKGVPFFSAKIDNASWVSECL